MIGFALATYQRGLLTKEDTGGIDLVWGSDRVLVEARIRMGERDNDFVRRLGEGTARLAEEFGLPRAGAGVS